MAFYFIGGEDLDFLRSGGANTTVQPGATYSRSANTRCSLAVLGFSGSPPTCGWQGALSQTVTSCWLTGRWYNVYNDVNTQSDFVFFLDGLTRRLGLQWNVSTKTLRLVKRDNAGTTTALATSSLQLGTGLQKLDMQIINYGVSGTVNVYIDNLLWFTYTGDLTTNGAASLSDFILGNTACNNTTPMTYWSEVICSSDDTRAMSLATLPPVANGNAFNWTGSWDDLNDVVLNDSDLATSATAGQLAQTAVGIGLLPGTPAIRAVAISARIQKGTSGPQNGKAVVRTGGNDHLGPALTMPVAMARTSTVFETNPATTGPWAYTDITAPGFNIGVQSET